MCLQILYRLKKINLITTLGKATTICPVTIPEGTSSDADNAIIIDPNLVNPWGMAFANDVLWVANNGTQNITAYNISGTELSQLGVNIGPVSTYGYNSNLQNPTGIIYNNNPSAFLYPININGSTMYQYPTVVTCTLQGGILGFYPPTSTEAQSSSSGFNTTPLYQNPNPSSSYTGMAVTTSNLILANFGNGTVDVFSVSTNSAGVLGPPTTSLSTLNGTVIGSTNLFSDPYPVPSYSPFNIVIIGNLVYVIYAKNNGLLQTGVSYILTPDSPTAQPLVPTNLELGAGKGYVNVFSLSGTFIKRFASGGYLNAPWGMMAAPMLCGLPPGSFFIGNFGDGTINIYTCNGIFLGKLRNCSGSIYRLGRLWSIISSPFGFNSIYIYMSSGIFNETQGLVSDFILC